MIQPPLWCKDAIPTTRGWRHPKRREILQSRRFTEEEVNEYMAAKLGTGAPAPIKPVVETKVEVECDVCEDDKDTCDCEDLSSMTKDELESWAREHLDIELDKRKTKKALLAEIEEHRNG